MIVYISLILFLCAPYKIDCQDTGCKFKYLTVSQDLGDKLNVYFQGNADEDYSGALYSHLQMYDITTGDPGTPIERQLESLDQPVKLGSSNIYWVSFDYTAGDGPNDINYLKEKKIRITLFLQESSVGNLITTGTVDANLVDVHEFPTTPDVKFITDPILDSGNGRLIRINDASTVNVETFVEACTGAPCYVYEETATSTKYAQCVDIKVSSEDLYLCSGEGSDPTEINDAGDAPDLITLDHHALIGGLEVKYSVNANNVVKTDLVIQSKDKSLKYCTGQERSGDVSKCIKQSFGENNDAFQIILVSYDDDSPRKYYYTAHDVLNNNLRIEFLSMEILEASWYHDTGNKEQYYVTRKEADDTDIVLTKAYVDCTAVGDPCNSYFVNINKPGNYFVTLQDYVSSAIDTVMVKSKDYLRPVSQQSRNNLINIHGETITANVEDQNIIVNVCFNHLKNVSMEDSYYELLVVSINGHWKSETVVNMKSDSYACFHSVELAYAHFKENSKALIMLRNGTNRNVLASGEIKIRVQEPDLVLTGDTSGNTNNNTVWIIVGTSAGFLTCLVALVALIYTKIIRNGKSDDRIQYPLHRNIVENSNISHGIENPAATI